MFLIKLFIKRFIAGFPIGVFIGQAFFTLFICIFKYQFTMDWQYALIHLFLYGAIGGYYAGISIVYSVEQWSYLKQVSIHWILMFPYLPLAWLNNWMPKTFWGATGFIIFYFALMLAFWLFYRAKYKKYVKKLNSDLANWKQHPN